MVFPLARLQPRVLLGLALLLGLACAVPLLNAYLVPSGDNATYLVLGQALSTGQGYRMISDPNRPPMALYPPGYPAVLALVLTVTGTQDNLPAAILPAKFVSLTIYVGVVLLTFALFARRNTWLGLATALLVAINPHVLYFAVELSTELPFLLLTLAAMLLFARRAHQDVRPALVLGVALLLALGFYVRSVALVVALALAFFLSLERQFRSAALLLLVVGLLALPWFVYSSSLPSTGTSVGLGRGYFALYFSTDPYGTTRATFGDWVARVVQNLRIYALDIWPDVLFPHALSVGRLLPGVGVVVGLLLSAVVLLGWVIEVRRREAGEWYVALFFASCAGYLWAQSRLIVPIVPFVIYYLMVGTEAVLRWLPGAIAHRRRGLLLVAMAVLGTSLLIVDARNIRRNLASGMHQSIETHYATDPEWGNYLQAMRWVEQNAQPGDIVICRKADLMYILTRHPSFEYPYTSNPETLAEFARANGVSYIIQDAFTWTRTTDQYLDPALEGWVAAEPDALTRTFETAKPRTQVWQVNK